MSAPLTPNPLVSFIITARNRPEVLGQTLQNVWRCGLKRGEFEILIIDRGEPDARMKMLAGRFPLVHLMAQAEGPRVRSLADALGASRGRYIVLLEDDSHPRPGAVLRMTTHFDANPRLGAAVFAITRPDGVQKHAPFPNVLVRCGTGLRRRAFEQVHRLPETLLEAGAEFDVSLQLLARGWEIQPFDDIHVTHLEVAQREQPDRVLRQQVRSDLLAAVRYFPKRWVIPLARDWMRRQRFGAGPGLHSAYYRGLLGALARAVSPRRRLPFDEPVFDLMLRAADTEQRLAEAAREHGLQRIVLLDFSPNLLAFWQAAARCRLDVVAIADSVLGGPRRSYRGIPVVDDAHARAMAFDAAILTSLSPTVASERLAQWRSADARPALDLFERDRPELTIFAARAPAAARRTAARSA